VTMISRSLIFSIALAALGVVCSGVAAEQQKIAVVDMESLIKSHPETTSAESLLQKQVDEFESERKDMITQFEKLQKDCDRIQKEAENKALSDSEKEKKRAVFEDKYAELKEQGRKISEMTTQRQKELNDQKLRMRRRIFSKIRDIVKEYADKKGYVTVLDSSALSVGGVETVVYIAEKNDITADIRKLVEEQKNDLLENPLKLDKKSSEK